MTAQLRSITGGRPADGAEPAAGSTPAPDTAPPGGAPSSAGRSSAVEARYHALVEASPDGILVHVRGRISFANRTAARLLGARSPDELVGRSILEVIHADYRGVALAQLQRLREGKAVRLQSERFVRLDGTDLAVEVESSALELDGEPAVQVVLRDISDRLRAEEELRASEERYRRLVESSPDALAVHADGRFVFANRAMAKLLGARAPEELIGLPILDVVAPEYHDVVNARIARELAEGRDAPLLEEQFVRLDGKRVDVEVAGIPITYQGRPAGQVVVRDVTERKRAEREVARALEIEREATERLRALDEMKTTILHAVSHELRTPLTAVLGLSLTLEREEVNLPQDERRDLLRRLAANARKLDELLSDLLDIDRLDRGIIQLNRRPTDLGELVRRSVEASGILGERRVTIAADALRANVDGPKVERIVENLLSNVARHTPVQARVSIRVRTAGDGIVIEVEDDGPGIPADLRDYVFEPFNRASPPAANDPGVGIGLSLVARFAALHGGRAWVESSASGGARFCVLLREAG